MNSHTPSKEEIIRIILAEYQGKVKPEIPVFTSQGPEMQIDQYLKHLSDMTGADVVMLLQTKRFMDAWFAENKQGGLLDKKIFCTIMATSFFRAWKLREKPPAVDAERLKKFAIKEQVFARSVLGMSLPDLNKCEARLFKGCKVDSIPAAPSLDVPPEPPLHLHAPPESGMTFRR